MPRPASLDGAVVLRQPIRHQVLVCFSGMFLLALSLFLTFGTYAKRQIAVGYVAPEAGLITVESPVGGVLDKLYVAEGGLVRKGQPLAVVSQQRELPGQGNVDVNIRQQLRASLSNLDGRIDSQASLGRLAIARLRGQRDILSAGQINLYAKARTARTKVDVASARVADFEKLLDARYVSKLSVDEERAHLLDAVSTRDDLGLELDKARASYADISLQIEQQHAETKSAIDDLARQQIDLRQRLLESQVHDIATVIAPVAGRVTAIRGHLGQPIEGRTPFLTLIPNDSNFIAELYVPSSAVGFVREGQKVFLRFKAFPHEQYGTHAARVVEIAKSPVAPRELPVPLSVPDEPLFRIRAALIGEGKSHQLGKHLRLQPGMLLDADIIIERRPLWQWLTLPLRSASARL